MAIHHAFCECCDCNAAYADMLRKTSNFIQVRKNKPPATTSQTIKQAVDFRMANDHVAALISAIVVSGNKELIDASEMAARQVFGIGSLDVHCKHMEAKAERESLIRPTKQAFEELQKLGIEAERVVDKIDGDDPEYDTKPVEKTELTDSDKLLAVKEILNSIYIEIDFHARAYSDWEIDVNQKLKQAIDVIEDK